MQHKELCSRLCGSLDAKRIWGRMDTCICIAESLCYAPETITTLLISYTKLKVQKKMNKQTKQNKQQKKKPKAWDILPLAQIQKRNILILFYFLSSFETMKRLRNLKDA